MEIDKIIVAGLVICLVAWSKYEIDEWYDGLTKMNAAEKAFEDFLITDHVLCHDHNFWGDGSSCPDCEKDMAS